MITNAKAACGKASQKDLGGDRLSDKQKSSKLRSADLAYQHHHRVVILIDYTFLQRNDGVVGDVNFFGADFSAAFGDVAQAEAEKIRPPGNDDAILRWNRCVRLLQTPSLAWEEQLATFEAEDAPPR